MFGLASWTDYHYYRGHVMWDIDAFAVPPLLLTDPGAAQALLRFRTARLDAARQNAAMAGRPRTTVIDRRADFSYVAAMSRFNWRKQATTTTRPGGPFGVAMR